MDKFPITSNGHVRLENELKTLKTEERPAVIKQIAVAREHGDLKENAEYHAARDKQSFIEGRILDLEDKMARAEIINPTSLSGDTVRFGATVKVVDEDTEEEVTYQIVGEYEADLKQKRVAITAPIARAFIGKSTGDSVEVNAPGGSKYYEILNVEYLDIV